MRRPDLLRLLMIASLGLAVLVAVLTFLTGRHIRANGGLGFDGVMYAGMVRGLLEPAPWGQRILAPFIVHLLRPSPTQIGNAFLIVNLVSFGIVVFGAGVLAGRIGILGHASPSHVWFASITTGALLVVLPFGLRWVWFDPVLVDPIASALGVWWFVAATSRPRPVRWLAVPLAALAVMAHQIWGPILVAGTLAQMMAYRDRSDFRLSVATLVAISAGVLAYVTTPTRGSLGLDTLQQAIQGYRAFLQSAYGAQNLIWALLFTFGLLPAVLLRRELLRPLLSLSWWGNRPRESSIILPIAAMAVVCGLESIAVGNDEQRYFFYDAAPFIVPVLMGYAAMRPELAVRLVVASIVSVTIWEPLYFATGQAGYGFFSPQFGHPGVVARLMTDLRNLVLPALLAFIIVIRWEATRHPAAAQDRHARRQE